MGRNLPTRMLALSLTKNFWKTYYMEMRQKRKRIALSCVEKLLRKIDDETKQFLLQSRLSEAVVTDTPGDFFTIEFVVTNARVVSTYLSSLMTTCIC